MKLEIRSVADKGNHQKERLVLKVISNTDIGDYLLIQAGYNEEGVTIGTYHTYWFPYKSVSASDLVILYTKSGKDSEKEIKQGKKAHFFYWGINDSIWNRRDRAPVLLHAPEWVSKSPDEL
jgi:hypothetical protein